MPSFSWWLQAELHRPQVSSSPLLCCLLHVFLTRDKKTAHPGATWGGGGGARWGPRSSLLRAPRGSSPPSTLSEAARHPWTTFRSTREPFPQPCSVGFCVCRRNTCSSALRLLWEARVSFRLDGEATFSPAYYSSGLAGPPASCNRPSNNCRSSDRGGAFVTLSPYGLVECLISVRGDYNYMLSQKVECGGWMFVATRAL